MARFGEATLVGRTLAHYRINAAIGAGGMGAVYRATDTKLGREVALKVLPPDVASDPERLGRFQREARAVAALNHPNVVTLYSVEESDGVHFLTMELIEGQPLERLISANGMPADRIIEIASAIAEALAAAHEKGIVHRDLKPANVMVTNEGRVKVLDFGLAKDVSAKTGNDATLTSAGHTQAGMVMGTPAYMSPEQVSGRPLDHRTDIFSFGVLLHEMAAGKRPFEGGSAELISSILRDTPPSVTDLRADLPADLARVIRRCLEKDPRHRMQTARDVGNEFRDMARTSTRPTPVSTSRARATVAADSGAARANEGFWVAVLPFKYAGNDADLAALADGLTDDVITGLSKFSYLRVVARSSSSRYSGQSVDVRTAGKELGARYVMEGSLRQAGSKLRLAVQLVEATTGSHLWAETYERVFQPESVFELQDDLVPRIVSTVADRHGVLPHSMSEAVQAKDPEQLTPYEAVLLSFSYAERITSDEQIAAKACLERAVSQMPGYADAWAMLAMLFCDEYGLGFKPEISLLERALEAARRAVKAGPSNHLAYQNLAYAHFLRREFGPCRNAAERSLALNSMDGSNVWFMGLVMAYTGDWERGCALVQRAMQLNPNFPGKYRYPLVADAYRKGDYRGALNEALRMNLPEVFYTPLLVAAASGQLGEIATAEKALHDLLVLKPDIAEIVRENLGKWFQPELVEHFIEGLAKAGLEMRAAGAAPATTSSAMSTARTISGETRADEGFWIAVLPFRYTGGNQDLKALAEGLSEEVITGLSRFSYLRVIARGSTAKYSSESDDVRAIGKELGARYVMEGSLRQAGNKLRLAVQLADTVSGAHLWAETYERAFTPESVFELQDDLVPRIVSTVADINGVLSRSMSEAVRQRNPEQLTPYEAVLRSFGYFERVTPEEMNAAIVAVESALQKAPTYADAWAMLALLSAQRYAQGFGPAAESLATGAAAARKAVEAAPANHLAWFSLSQVLFFQKEFRTFRNTAERALTLNPMDSNSLALNGEMLALSGEWERGVSLSVRARQLNPHHPGWYWHSDFNHAYRQRDYRAALEIASKMNQTSNWGAWALTAAACGQLGDRDGAAKAIRELLKLRPDAVSRLREDCDKWFDAEHAAHIMEGFRKAGLEVDAAVSEGLSAAARVAGVSSGAARADEGFWVAVLPFKYTGGNQDLKALAEGLSEEVITGLSRFSYLRVIARGSTVKYSSESGDVRAIGRELGARYVMEGSLRQAGNKLRLAVQLADTVSGAHLWAETYERAFTPESVFELQDDLVPRIVSTIADQYGVLPRTMSEGLRSKSEDALTPHEAVLRAFSYFTRITPDEHAAVRRVLERAVREAPDHADSWAMLSMIYRGEFAQGYNAGPNPLDRALAAAQRAVELAPTHALGHYSLASVHFFRKEMIPFRVAAERTLALNPLDAAARAYLGLLIASAGEWDRGCQMVESAMQLNPNCPGYFYFARCRNAYRQGKYAEALEAVARVNMPSYFHVPALQAAALGQLGQREEAQEALRDLLALRPDFASAARQEYAKWYDAEQVEHIIDGLRKAGLEIPEDQKKDRKPAPSGPVSAAQSIAVLPFANLSADPEQDYFSDGLAEEIINLLAQIAGLKVIARTSAFAFRGKEQDIRRIAETLGVNTVLEGSVRRSGSRIRVTAQLINAADGSHLWSERYDRELSDIFAMQDEISAAIAKALRVKLSRETAPQRYTPKLEAYEAYLKARYQEAKVTPESMELARRFYEQAGELDPGFAMPHVGLGFYWHNLAHFGRHFARECVPPARAETQRALQIDPSLPEAHALLGYMTAMYELDWAAAERHFDFPGTKEVSFGLLRPLYGWVQFWRGNVDPAIKLAQRAIEEDPLEVWARMNLHAYLQGAGRDDEALEQLKKVVELDPNQVIALVSMAMIHADKGDLAEALRIARRAYAVGPWSPDTVGVLAALLRRNGEQEESELLAKELGSGEAPGDARAHALFHLLCGKIDQGADWAEKAVEQRDASMMVYLRFVVCKGLRASHRWPKIAKMVNLC